MDWSGFWAAAQPILLQLLYAVLVIGVPILTKYATDYLRGQLSDAEWERAVKWADMIVEFLDQVGLYRGMENSDKKAYAVNTLLAEGSGMKLDLDRDLADKLIESAVQRLKAKRAK